MPASDGYRTAAMLEVWDTVGALAPPSGELMGGTALAVHLEHRRSEDLDIFVYEPFDPLSLLEHLKGRGEVEAEYWAEGTLNCRFGGVKLQFLWAKGQQRLEAGLAVGKMMVGSFPDVVASKLKVIGDRGELRDYYDLMCIETAAHTPVLTMLQWYSRRYRVAEDDQSVYHIVRALGSFADVADDPWLSESLGRPDLPNEIAEYWQRRQPQIAQAMFGQTETP